MDKYPDLLLDMIAALPDPVFVITESGRYVALLGGHDRQYYHDGSHLVNFTLDEVLPPEKANWFLQQIRITLGEDHLRLVEYALSGEQVQGLNLQTGPAGEIWFEGRIQPLPSKLDGERAVVWVASNITERHNLERKLQHLSETDELTGANNRRKLMELLELRFAEFLRYNTDQALILFDLDFFKGVNDKHGHLFGDQVLREVVTLCQEQLRDPDSLGRMGGEEFAVLLPNTNLSRASAIAERLRSLVENYRFVNSSAHPVKVTISLGVATMHSDDNKAESVIRRADDALYSAKHSGRNCIFCESES